MTRQSITDPKDAKATLQAYLPKPNSQAQRSRSYEQAHPVASYRLPVELRQEVTELAGDLSVTTSDLVTYLLQYGLAHLDRDALLDAREWRPGKAQLNFKGRK